MVSNAIDAGETCRFNLVSFVRQLPFAFALTGGMVLWCERDENAVRWEMLAGALKSRSLNDIVKNVSQL